MGWGPARRRPSVCLRTRSRAAPLARVYAYHYHYHSIPYPYTCPYPCPYHHYHYHYYYATPCHAILYDTVLCSSWGGGSDLREPLPLRPCCCEAMAPCGGGACVGDCPSCCPKP